MIGAFLLRDTEVWPQGYEEIEMPAPGNKAGCQKRRTHTLLVWWMGFIDNMEARLPLRTTPTDKLPCDTERLLDALHRTPLPTMDTLDAQDNGGAKNSYTRLRCWLPFLAKGVHLGKEDWKVQGNGKQIACGHYAYNTATMI